MFKQMVKIIIRTMIKTGFALSIIGLIMAGMEVFKSLPYPYKPVLFISVVALIGTTEIMRED